MGESGGIVAKFDGSFRCLLEGRVCSSWLDGGHGDNITYGEIPDFTIAPLL